MQGAVDASYTFDLVAIRVFSVLFKVTQATCGSINFKQKTVPICYNGVHHMNQKQEMHSMKISDNNVTFTIVLPLTVTF
jgi:hypothetical protein